MVGITALGLLISLAVVYVPQLGLFHLWWIFNTIAATVVVPTILSLYWKRLSAKGVFFGTMVSFLIGLPLFIYVNIINNLVGIVLTSIGIVLVSTFFCLLMPKKHSQSPSKIFI